MNAVALRSYTDGIFPVGFSRQERAFGAPNDGWICLYINIYYIYMYCTYIYIYILCIKYILLGGDLSILKHMSQWEGSSHLWKIKFLFETTNQNNIAAMKYLSNFPERLPFRSLNITGEEWGRVGDPLRSFASCSRSTIVW